MENNPSKNLHEKVTRAEIDGLFKTIKDLYEDLEKSNNYLSMVRLANHQQATSIEEEAKEFNEMGTRINSLEEFPGEEILKQLKEQLEYLSRYFSRREMEISSTASSESPENGGL